MLLSLLSLGSLFTFVWLPRDLQFPLQCPSMPSRPVPIVAQGLRPWLHLGYHQGVESLPNDEAGDLLFTSRLPYCSVYLMLGFGVCLGF